MIFRSDTPGVPVFSSSGHLDHEPFSFGLYVVLPPFVLLSSRRNRALPRPVAVVRVGVGGSGGGGVVAVAVDVAAVDAAAAVRVQCWLLRALRRAAVETVSSGLPKAEA